MEQSKVREQIEKGKGTQFDPKFADIMIQMIDEDKDYRTAQNAGCDFEYISDYLKRSK